MSIYLPGHPNLNVGHVTASRCHRRASRAHSHRHGFRGNALPHFLPPAAAEVTEPEAMALMAQLQCEPVVVPGYSQPVQTVFSGPAGTGAPPYLLQG